MPSAVPRGGDECSGQAPGANSLPALRQNGGCALPLRGSFSPRWPWHQRPLLRGPGERSRPSGALVPLFPIHPSSSAQKRERESAIPALPLLAGINPCQPREAASPGETEPLACARSWVSAAGAISKPELEPPAGSA